MDADDLSDIDTDDLLHQIRALASALVRVDALADEPARELGRAVEELDRRLRGGDGAAALVAEIRRGHALPMTPIDEQRMRAIMHTIGFSLRLYGWWDAFAEAWS